MKPIEKILGHTVGVFAWYEPANGKFEVITEDFDGNMNRLKIDEKFYQSFLNWQNDGGNIQDVLPGLDPGIREQLISGMLPEQQEVFNG